MRGTLAAVTARKEGGRRRKQSTFSVSPSLSLSLSLSPSNSGAAPSSSVFRVRRPCALLSRRRRGRRPRACWFFVTPTSEGAAAATVLLPTTVSQSVSGGPAALSRFLLADYFVIVISQPLLAVSHPYRLTLSHSSHRNVGLDSPQCASIPSRRADKVIIIPTTTAEECGHFDAIAVTDGLRQWQLSARDPWSKAQE